MIKTSHFRVVPNLGESNYKLIVHEDVEIPISSCKFECFGTTIFNATGSFFIGASPQKRYFGIKLDKKIANICVMKMEDD